MSHDFDVIVSRRIAEVFLETCERRKTLRPAISTECTQNFDSNYALLLLTTL
jgi:hypothetical protein